MTCLPTILFRHTNLLQLLKNNTLFLYGGVALVNGQWLQFTHITYDTQSNLWRIPEITGIPPNKRTGVTLLVDNNGLIYLFADSAYTNNQKGKLE